jgi:hypothetical protein
VIFVTVKLSVLRHSAGRILAVGALVRCRTHPSLSLGVSARTIHRRESETKRTYRSVEQSDET